MSPSGHSGTQSSPAAPPGTARERSCCAVYTKTFRKRRYDACVIFWPERSVFPVKLLSVCLSVYLVCLPAFYFFLVGVVNGLPLRIYCTAVFLYFFLHNMRICLLGGRSRFVPLPSSPSLVPYLPSTL